MRDRARRLPHRHSAASAASAFIRTNSRPVRYGIELVRLRDQPEGPVGFRIAARRPAADRDLPVEGPISPEIIFRVVDLPEPFGPSSAVTPGADAEREVGDRHQVAIPLRDMLEHDRRLAGEQRDRARRGRNDRRWRRFGSLSNQTGHSASTSLHNRTQRSPAWLRHMPKRTSDRQIRYLAQAGRTMPNESSVTSWSGLMSAR